ncbi:MULTISPECIES: hypothetical protein [Sphingobium]|jgi:hypothetical protein|uniref:hypothetical protein n=1 Tax=Sphingobium TaxID=165695 RepID=UPI0011AE1832|nr:MULTISPECIES: hypothetical protein [Sphingobium]KAA9013442.1 hypothetical protein F4U94_16590 [Sphingobium limneticum]
MRFETEKYIGKNLLNAPERELVQYLCNESSSLYWFFNFVVEPAIGPPPRPGWDYIIFAEVPREDLGLKPGQPGDIDILIIPTFHGQPRPEFAAAIEVKRLALRGPNWSKNVDRYGITQANGLLKAGFPYVGILHLIMNAPGPTENWRNLQEFKVVGDDGRVEFVAETEIDMTGPIAAERQFSRLLKQNPHPSIGLNCVAVSQTLYSEGSRGWLSVTDPELRHASKSQFTHPVMLANLKTLADCASPHLKMRPADARRNQN